MARNDLKLTQIEDVIRIRTTQRALPLSRELATVRANLEERIGPTVSQRFAASALGVSHTAVQRWIASGDVPVVMNQRGRKEIPTRFLIDLAMKIDRDRGASGRRHLIEPVMTENRRRAERIRHRQADHRSRRSADPHARAVGLALEYHRAVADQITREQVDEALRTVWRLRDRGLMHPKYADAWERILAGDVREVKSAITAESEFGRDLRQNSPFAGVLSEAERAAVLAVS